MAYFVPAIMIFALVAILSGIPPRRAPVLYFMLFVIAFWGIQLFVVPQFH